MSELTKDIIEPEPQELIDGRTQDDDRDIALAALKGRINDYSVRRHDISSPRYCSNSNVGMDTDPDDPTIILPPHTD